MKYFDKNRRFFQSSCHILWISIKRFFKENQSQHATALTYYTLFAIVPILALLFGIAKGFNLDNRLKVFISQHFAEQQDIMDLMYNFADTTLKQADGSVIAGIGVLFLLVTVIRLATYIESSFNQTWQLHKGRNIFRKISDFLSMLLVAPILFVILSSSTLLLKNTIMKMSSFEILSMHAGILCTIGIQLIPILVSWLVFSLIYMTVPNTKVKLSASAFAGLFSAILYQTIQMLYITTQVKLSSYNTIYGSFSALPLFLILMQWSWLITLLGNQIAFVYQNYGTGQFDTDLGKISNELTTKYTLSVCKVIVDNFEEKKPSLSVEDIAKITKLPLIQVQDAIYTLIDSKVICRVDLEEANSFSYIPNMPTDKLTIVNVLTAIRQKGLNYSEQLKDIELNSIITLYDDLNVELDKSKNNKLIRDI